MATARGETGPCVREEEWKYSAAFPGVPLALQPVRAWGRGQQGGFLRGPRIHLMLHQQTGREGPPWPRQSSWLHKNAAPDNCRLQLHHSRGDNVPAPAQVRQRGAGGHSYTPWAMERGWHPPLSSAALATSPRPLTQPVPIAVTSLQGSGTAAGSGRTGQAPPAPWSCTPSAFTDPSANTGGQDRQPPVLNSAQLHLLTCPRWKPEDVMGQNRCFMANNRKPGASRQAGSTVKPSKPLQ